MRQSQKCISSVNSWLPNPNVTNAVLLCGTTSDWYVCGTSTKIGGGDKQGEVGKTCHHSQLSLQVQRTVRGREKTVPNTITISRLVAGCHAPTHYTLVEPPLHQSCGFMGKLPDLITNSNLRPIWSKGMSWHGPRIRVAEEKRNNMLLFSCVLWMLA